MDLPTYAREMLRVVRRIEDERIASGDPYNSGHRALSYKLDLTSPYRATEYRTLSIAYLCSCGIEHGSLYGPNYYGNSEPSIWAD